MSIEEILNDPESIQDLQDLADMFFANDSESNNGENYANENEIHGENYADPSGENYANDNNNADNDNFGGFDWTILFKVQEIFAEYNKEDANTKLLKSIEPFLSEDRRERAEKAAKIIKLVSVAQLLKENGMLNDLI
jgi:hypothetical protein